MRDTAVNETETPDAKAYSIYDKTVQDAVKNIVFIVLGALFLYWLIGAWLLGAKILFYVFAAIIVLSVLALIYKTFGVLLLVFSARAKADAEDWMRHGTFWLVAANIMRWVEALIGCGAVYILYAHIWKH